MVLPLIFRLSGLQQSVDFCFQVAFGDGSYVFVHRLAVLEENECRHTAYAVFHCDVFTLLDVAFRYGHLAVVFFCQLCKDRGEGAARTAPCSPEIDHYRLIAVDENAEILIISARTESDIAEMESYEDRKMFLDEMGLEESGSARLIQGAYKLLGLQTFFTAGADECRAWTINKGDKAPKAAGVIHSDFEKGFIRAEVIKYEDFINYKSEAAVRAAGKLATEGKEYIVQDGDIMHFLFNV